jgi:predicted transcriptional regulator
MAATNGNDKDAYTMILATILKVCENGCTKDKIIQETQLSHDQLRRIMAEMVDRELLHYIEASSVYITTDKGYIFLNRRQLLNSFHNNFEIIDNRIETKKELNSIASKQNIIHRKLQLWTNRYQNEFAIRLTGDLAISISGNDNDRSNIFLASTNPKEDYITAVAETDYFDDLIHGWEYTLRRLIEQYKHKIRTASLQKSISMAGNKASTRKEGEEQHRNNTNIDKAIPIRLIPYIKCGYCNSEFISEKEKNEHELEWHV